MVAYLELADYLLIAEPVLGVSASQLARLDRIGLADAALNAPSAVFDGKQLYPDFETKAAVLCLARERSRVRSSRARAAAQR